MRFPSSRVRRGDPSSHFVLWRDTGRKYPSRQSFAPNSGSEFVAFAVHDNGFAAEVQDAACRQTPLRPTRLRLAWLPRGERWGRKNMCFCETNPIVMLANRPVTYSPAVGCVHERENLNRVRLGKPNPFWRGSVGSFGSAQSPCATPFGRRHYATPSPRRLDLRQLRVCASRADFASTPEQDLLTSLVRTCRRPPTNHWRP